MCIEFHEAIARFQRTQTSETVNNSQSERMKNESEGKAVEI